MSPTKPLVAINIADLSPVDDAFTRLNTVTPLTWRSFSGLPANALERSVRRIRLSRYRGAWQAARAARDGDLITSHLPLMSAAVAQALRLNRSHTPHLAFAFNFTKLPTGKRLRYLRDGLGRIDRFAVFSQFEQDLYSRHFELPRERFEPVLWTQDAPPIDRTAAGLAAGAPFLCAIGGEGRDFAAVLEAARRVAPARVVIIARPHSLDGLAIPANVEIRVNRPLAETWGIAAQSCGVMLPLTAADTCCGHITLVSAKLLGVPALTTRSLATTEYVSGRAGVLQAEPGDPSAFAMLAQRALDEREAIGAAARASVPHERQQHDRGLWAQFVDRFVADHVG